MLCLLFQSTLARLERIHDETLEMLRTRVKTASAHEYRRLEIAARNAQFDLRLIRMELIEHEQSHAINVSP